MLINNEHILRKIIEHNFTWGMLDKKYNEIAQLKCNVYCMFHENHDTPSAKFYYNDEDEIWVLYCYSEKRVYTAYDFLKKILCEEKQLYKSPLDYLEQHMSDEEIRTQYKIIESQDANMLESKYDKKKQYIDNLYNESYNVIDFIEELYTA